MHRSKLLFLALLIGSTGCTVFTDYNSTTEDGRNAFLRGDFKAAQEEYAEGLDATGDALLYHFEAATVAHVAKDYDKSADLLEKTYKTVKEYQDQALLEEAAQIVGSVLVNEKTLTYNGAIFEQLLMQCYQARNDFLRGARDLVLSDIIRCYEIQGKAKAIYEKELNAVEQESRQKQREAPDLDIGEVHAKMNEAYDYGELDQAEDVYDIAYIRYVNAWLREVLSGGPDDDNQAWFDLRVVADRHPNVEFVQRDLIRMAARSGAVDDAKTLSKKWGVEPYPKDHGSVTLFFECGMAPHKEELKVYFPTYKGAAAFAMPIYKTTPNPVQGAVLEIGGTSEPTVVLSNMDSIAFRYHQDRMPILIAKQIIRLIVKIGIQSGGTVAIEQATAGTEHAFVGQLAALGYSAVTSAYNVISEQADLRCWLTLPQTLQATRVWLPAGTYPARIRLLGGGTFDLGTITVKAGKHRMIQARSLQSNLFWDVAPEPYDTGVTQVTAANDRNEVVVDLTEQQ